MVKVVCHGCEAPYQIDERRIPAAGLKMRCPKCGTSLLVPHPDGPAAAPPAPAPPAPPPRPAANPPGDFGGIDLPAVAPAAPPRPPPAPFGGGGGFGEIDLGSESGAGGAGEIDLPAARGAAPSPGGFGSVGADFGAVDLPAARPAPPGPSFGLGGLPAAAPAPDFGAVDLPAPAAPRPPPPPAGLGGLPASGGGFGEVDLPATRDPGVGLPARGGGGLPQAAGYTDLPAVAGGSAGLPSPSMGNLPAYAPSGGAGLPMVGGGAALPSVSSGGLPVAAQAGLPSVGGAGLPTVGGAGLPSVGGAGLPTVGGAGLPSMSHGGLPAVGSGGLPIAAGAGLPMTGGAGFPSASAGGLPSMSSAGLPAMGGGLPMTSGSGLPMTAGGGGPAHDPFGSVSGAGLSMPQGSPELGFGHDASLGGAHEPGGVGIGSVDVGAIGGIGGIGGEVELEGSLPAGAAGTLLQLPKPTRSVSAEAGDEAPAKPSRLKLVAGVGVAAILLGGLALSATSLGPFGIYAISDTLSASSYDANLASLAEEVTTSLDADTHAAAVQAIDRARAVQASQKRHAATAAYAAYVAHAKSVRFGRDSAAEAQAKSLLESVDRSIELRELALALAAEAAVEGELARAREQIGRVQASHAEDIDAAVLAGEVELLAKAPDAAIAAFTKAIALHKSPRTLFGLARAQLAAGKPAEAEVTAKSVLDSSKGHVAARTMLASIAASTPEREKEALAHLEAVTQDAAVRANASSSELVEVYVQLGRVHLMGSRVSQAQDAYGEALKLNPQAVAALVGSGELFYRAGRYSEAEARFESALRADADNIDAKVGTAKTWLRLERQKEAKDLLKKLKEAHPTEARVPYWLARVEESMGTRKEAEALYKEAIQKATTSDTAVPPYVALANLLTSVGRPSDASKALREAAEKFPDSPDLSRARGDVALQTGNYEQALEQYSAALKKGEDLGTLFSLGVTLRRMRQFDQAVQVFDKVAKVDKEYPGLALERGLYYEETGQSDLALQMYAEALQKAPNDIDLKLRIGSTLVAAGQSKQAEPSLKEVIRERPNSAEANHFLGRAMLLSGSNLNESMRFLQRAVDLDGNRAEYFLYVGWAANEAGQPARADAALAKALELDSSLGDAYWQRGVLLQKQGATLDAIADLNRALELRPSRYEAYATLALCHEDQSAWAKAEESWRRALKGNETQSDWQYRLAKVLKRKGDGKGSLEAMERAVELAENRDPRPGWLADAHFVLGDAYKGTDKDKAIQHFSEFLRLSTPDNAYRVDAERALATLKPR